MSILGSRCLHPVSTQTMGEALVGSGSPGWERGDSDVRGAHMPKKRPRPFLDSKDIKIVQFVVRNPQASVRVIAQAVLYPESTIQKRLAHLLLEGYLERII